MSSVFRGTLKTNIIVYNEKQNRRIKKKLVTKYSKMKLIVYVVVTYFYINKILT